MPDRPRDQCISQADDPNLTVSLIEDDVVVLELRRLVLAESELESLRIIHGRQ